MSDFITIKTEVEEEPLVTQPCSVRLEKTNEPAVCELSMNSVIENQRKTFFEGFKYYITDFQNTTLQNEEQALLMYSALSSAVCNALSSCSSERNDVTRLGRLLAEMSKKLDDMLKASNPISFDVGRPSTATSENQHPHSHSDTTEFESAAFQSTQIDFNLDESKRRFGCEPSSSRPTTSNQSMFKEILHSKMQNKDRVSGQSSESESESGQSSESESESGQSSESESEVKDSSHRENAVIKIRDWRIKVHEEERKVELLGCYLFASRSLSTIQVRFPTEMEKISR
ncbi:uncharacterized protein LOC111052167 isoform X2 [Nilaparvata lugens]|uniref:uncharacterized protein LOC111052167 isoform X2 n=1 Tax=Nilaparvata lugens TaxID=108931 RepID=UPI00193E6018|nr:uncharacterized protein LOC111052167 isoform X2 [Nilaparvata lugens]